MLRFLVQSAEDINSSLDLDTVFKKVADRIRSVVDAQLFCVMLWNEDTRLLEHSFSLCFGERIALEGGFPLGTGISGTCAAERRPIRVAAVRNHESYVRHRHPEVEIRTYRDAGHGFNCDLRADYHAEAAALARHRSLAFLARHLG